MKESTAKKPLLTIFLVVFFDLLAFGIVIPILPYYSREFGANALELGWLMAIYSVAQFACSPLWGALSDRWGRRPVLLLTIAAGAVSMGATALATSYLTLFLARLFAGIFAANISTASAYIADITGPEDRAKGMGIIGAGFGLGFIFGPAIGGILSAHGYGWPLGLAAGLGACNLVFAFFTLHEPPREGHEPARRLSLTGFRAAFANPATAWPILLFLLVTVAFTQLEVIFGLFVLERFGYGAREAGWLLAGTGLVSAFLQGGAIGRLVKKFGERSLLPMGFSAQALAMAGAAFAPSPAWFMFSLFWLAIGNGLSNPILSSLVSKGAAPSGRGAVMGVYQSAGSLARIVGPPVAGLLFDRVGVASPLLLSAGVVTLAAGLAFTNREKFT